MEKKGLSHGLECLKHNRLDVQVLVTDRHKKIKKWLRETKPTIKHYYDVWHVAKGLFILQSVSPWFFQRNWRL